MFGEGTFLKKITTICSLHNILTAEEYLKRKNLGTLSSGVIAVNNLSLSGLFFPIHLQACTNKQTRRLAGPHSATENSALSLRTLPST